MATAKKKSKEVAPVAASQPPAFLLEHRPRRFVLISDLHLHPWAAFSAGDGANNSRLKQTLSVLDASLKAARATQVPWVFGGDIVHTAGFTYNVVMAELTELLQQYDDVIKLVIWGNHDARGIGGKITLDQTVFATLQRAVDNFVTLDHAGVVSYNGLTFSGKSYQPRTEYLGSTLKQSDVGVYHQTVRGTKGPNGFALEEGVDGNWLMAHHKFVAVGHVHHWQNHTAGNGPGQLLLIPGAPEQHNFGDVGEKGWWVIDVPDGSGDPVAHMVESGSPKFLTVESSAEVHDDGNFYRVRAMRPGDQELPGNAVAIVPAPTVVEQRDALQGARGQEILEAWAKIEAPDPALDTQQVLAAGKELLGSHEQVSLRSFKVTEVNLRNFCSYESETLFVKDGTWLVTGRGKDFPSNGAGKSTLFEAIYWALFGSTTKGQGGDDVIKYGAKDCEVSITLESGVADAHGGPQYLYVRRSRGSKSQLTVRHVVEAEMYDENWDAKSVNEMTEKLQRYLGITPDLFKALGYFSQEDLVLFASATDGKRKDMLADLIGLGAYQDAATAAGRRAAEATQAWTRLQAMVDVERASVYSRGEEIAQSRAQSDKWLSDNRARLVAQADRIRVLDETMEQRRATMEEAQLSSLGAQLRERAGKVADQLLKARADVESLPTDFVAVTNAELTAATVAAATASERVRAAKTLVDSAQAALSRQGAECAQLELQAAQGQLKCPTCNQLLSSEKFENVLGPARRELAAREAAVDSARAEHAALASAAADHRLKLRDVQAAYDTARMVAQAKDALVAAQSARLDVQKEHDELEVLVKARVARELSDERGRAESALAAIEAEQNPYTHAITSLQRVVDQAQAAHDKYCADQAIATVERMTYEYWTRGFGKQGIQSLLLDEVAGLFNNVRGSIFPALTQGVYDVQFSTLSRTAKGEVRERTEFQVFAHGEAVQYESLSGGQRRRIDVGVMLTLVKAVSSWMLVPGALGMLVLDEVCGFLDSSGAEGLMEALQSVREQVPAIFVVSHEPQLQSLFPEVIQVVQDEHGTTRINSVSA